MKGEINMYKEEIERIKEKQKKEQKAIDKMLENSNLDKGLCSYENCPIFRKQRDEVIKRYDSLREAYLKCGKVFEDIREYYEKQLTLFKEVKALLTYSWGY